jgi:hypothetical protein
MFDGVIGFVEVAAPVVSKIVPERTFEHADPFCPCMSMAVQPSPRSGIEQ